MFCSACSLKLESGASEANIAAAVVITKQLAVATAAYFPMLDEWFKMCIYECVGRVAQPL
jgi:hypothetical protein